MHTGKGAITIQNDEQASKLAFLRYFSELLPPIIVQHGLGKKHNNGPMKKAKKWTQKGEKW
jgi:hypothetical protein